MATIEAWGEVVETEPGFVRMRMGAEGHKHRILFELPEGQSDRPFRDAMRRREQVRILIEVPATDRQNRQAAEDMVRDMKGEIEG
jgi:hypothetical protein